MVISYLLILAISFECYNQNDIHNTLFGCRLQKIYFFLLKELMKVGSREKCDKEYEDVVKDVIEVKKDAIKDFISYSQLHSKTIYCGENEVIVLFF